MLELLPSLLRLGAAGSLRAASRRMGLTLLYVLLAAIAAIAALGCAIAGIWLALLPAIGPVWTPLLIGAVLAGIAAILVLLVARRSPRRTGLGGSGDGVDPAALLSAIFRDHKTSLLLGAALAGLLAGSDLTRPRREPRDVASTFSRRPALISVKASAGPAMQAGALPPRMSQLRHGMSRSCQAS